MGNVTGFDTNPFVAAIRDTAQQIQLSSDLQHIIEDYLYKSRKFKISSSGVSSAIFHAGIMQFQSVSYAACIEWALQQPPHYTPLITELEAKVTALQVRLDAQEGDGR